MKLFLAFRIIFEHGVMSGATLFGVIDDVSVHMNILTPASVGSPTDVPTLPAMPTLPAASSSVAPSSPTECSRTAASSEAGFTTPSPQAHLPKRNAPSSTEQGPDSQPQKKKKPDDTFVWLKDLMDDVFTGEVSFDIDRCLPASVKANPLVGRTATFWNLLRLLEMPIRDNITQPKRFLGTKAVTVNKTKSYIHLCVECCKEVKALGGGTHEESWRRGLCKISNTSNAVNHLRSKHRLSVAVQAFFSGRERQSQSTGALDSGNGKMRKLLIVIIVKVVALSHTTVT